MKKLLDILALDKQAGDFGIEIEVEGRQLPHVENGYWKTEADGSLRNGMEYIFKRPKPLKDVPAMLRMLNRAFKEEGSELSFSFRTSVHVHMNVQELTYQQILNTIYTYLLLEAPLINFCGEERKGNRFCLRLEDAEGAMTVFTQLFSRGERFLREMGQDHVRYAAINIEALRKYGSLEFRAMKGTVDVERITTWCTALYNIREFAKEQESPAAIFNLFAKMEAQAFSALVLKETAPTFTYPELVRDMQRSFSLAIDLPFAYAASVEKDKARKEMADKQFVAPDMAFPDKAVRAQEYIRAFVAAAPLNPAPIAFAEWVAPIMAADRVLKPPAPAKRRAVQIIRDEY